MLSIKGLQPMTLVDYPGKVACTVFLPNCNFRCGYCHNGDLVLNPAKMETIEEDEFFSFLNSRKGWIDAVVITGGEPTIHAGLTDFVKKVKALGFLVKLDTNGTIPAMIDGLINRGLVDYIAMDIKSSPSRYSDAAGAFVNVNILNQSIKLIRESGVEYEFRMTVEPSVVNASDVEEVAKWLSGANKFVIQNFKPSERMINNALINTKPYSDEELNSFADILKKTIKCVEVR